MSQKKFWADRTMKTIGRVVVAREACQLDCSAAQAQPGMGSQMDSAVSAGWPDVVSRTIPKTVQAGSPGQSGFRAHSAPHPCPTEKPEKPAGFHGAEVIYHELADLKVRPLHSVRTIHRILVRHQLLSRKRRNRSRKGPLLPTPAAQRQNDVHQLDFIVGHYLAARRPVVVLNRKDLATGFVCGYEEPDRRVQRVRALLTKDWQRHGIPTYLQVDNDMSLTGGRMHPRSLGQLVRFCLACRVIPVFIPERHPSANAQVERYNGLWQEKVWQRYRFRRLADLRVRSQAFQNAYNGYLTGKLIRQGKQGVLKVQLRHLPKELHMPEPLPLCRGQIWFIRVVNEDGSVQILNETIQLPKRYAQELVRVVVRTGPQTLSAYWRASGQIRFNRIAHRAYTLREKARTPFV